MERLQWSALLETGVPEMDASHHALLDAIHAAVDARAEMMCQRLNELQALLASDFAHEERIMDRLHYPASHEHRAAHRRVLAALEHALQVVGDGDCDSAHTLLERLPRWFLGHLSGMDLPLALAYERAATPYAQPPSAGLRQQLAKLLQEQST